MANVTLSDREKVAILFGMVRAFEAVGKWPKHFNKEDKAALKGHARAARDILGKGASSPSDRWAAINYADDELQGEEFV